MYAKNVAPTSYNGAVVVNPVVHGTASRKKLLVTAFPQAHAAAERLANEAAREMLNS